MSFFGNTSFLTIRPFQAPNANAVAERWVRSIREECLDQLIILNAAHLRSVLKEYSRYYNPSSSSRLAGKTPIPLPQLDLDGNIRYREILGGVLHDYFREVA
jgi:putative transposase